MILDTQYLGALADNDEAARAKGEELDRSAVATRVPAAVVRELYTGIGNAPLEEKGEQLRSLYRRLLASRSTVDLSPGVARKAGELNGKHMKSDSLKDLDGADSVVAAHGLRRDEPVLSNDSDFQDVEGLEVVTY